MACDRCKLPYPEELTTPMFMNSGYTKPVCGLCALALVNEFHGANLKQFQGEQAEAMRQGAIRWRKKHGHRLDS